MASSKQQTTQEPPIDVPVGFNAWLLDCAPDPNCDVCQANWRQLTAARNKGDITQAARHATEIRDHASGVH
ncbi:hypothetical protein G5C60_08310 [Streptomyces sp. HC44]|uniref:Uncharacterized protein n=1 Tax=Streptomyces scabichelini TaxID=2711217 RepID=A0A6G4V0Y4_9ACTN|nr:hypothetical protein [Streptomyces scabichelini]NGO07656.1 hypothetical protein [Streptomyces scabichelini]